MAIPGLMMTWHITYKIDRFKPGKPPRTDTFEVEIEPHRTVLDGIEKIWAEQDRTLTYRHACHHASCGSCAVVVNGVEVLPCIVELRDVTDAGGTIHVGPLRNLPVVGDLVVDMAPLFERMQQVDMPIVGPTEPFPNQTVPEDIDGFIAFENCIECGMCLSACPVVATNSRYFGPAALAAAHQEFGHRDGDARRRILDLVDTEDGIWRCHVAYECSAVCPSNVDPAGKIMMLRRRATVRKVKSLFGLSE